MDTSPKKYTTTHYPHISYYHMGNMSFKSGRIAKINWNLIYKDVIHDIECVQNNIIDLTKFVNQSGSPKIVSSIPKLNSELVPELNL